MDTGQIITGVILIIWGGFGAIAPEKVLEWRKWVSKKIYGADFRPSTKTMKIQQALGIVFVILGFLIIVRG